MKHIIFSEYHLLLISFQLSQVLQDMSTFRISFQCSLQGPSSLTVAENVFRIKHNITVMVGVLDITTSMNPICSVRQEVPLMIEISSPYQALTIKYTVGTYSTCNVVS